jgi:hypothetical protein
MIPLQLLLDSIEGTVSCALIIKISNPQKPLPSLSSCTFLHVCFNELSSQGPPNWEVHKDISMAAVGHQGCLRIIRADMKDRAAARAFFQKNPEPFQ